MLFDHKQADEHVITQRYVTSISSKRSSSLRRLVAALHSYVTTVIHDCSLTQ